MHICLVHVYVCNSGGWGTKADGIVVPGSRRFKRETQSTVVAHPGPSPRMHSLATRQGHHGMICVSVCVWCVVCEHAARVRIVFPVARTLQHTHTHTHTQASARAHTNDRYKKQRQPLNQKEADTHNKSTLLGYSQTMCSTKEAR